MEEGNSPVIGVGRVGCLAIVGAMGLPGGDAQGCLCDVVVVMCPEVDAGRRRNTMTGVVFVGKVVRTVCRGGTVVLPRVETMALPRVMVVGVCCSWAEEGRVLPRVWTSGSAGRWVMWSCPTGDRGGLARSGADEGRGKW